MMELKFLKCPSITKSFDRDDKFVRERDKFTMLITIEGTILQKSKEGPEFSKCKQLSGQKCDFFKKKCSNYFSLCLFFSTLVDVF